MADDHEQETGDRSSEGEKGPTNEYLRQRARRNRAIAMMVVGFIILIYLVTVLRLGGSVAERSF